MGERESVPVGLPLRERALVVAMGDALWREGDADTLRQPEAEGLRLGVRVAVGQRVMVPHADPVRERAAVVAPAEAVREIPAVVATGEELPQVETVAEGALVLATPVRERESVGDPEPEGLRLRVRVAVGQRVRVRVRVGDPEGLSVARELVDGRRRSKMQNRSFIFWRKEIGNS